jgi:hypothetical protein
MRIVDRGAGRVARDERMVISTQQSPARYSGRAQFLSFYFTIS